MKVFMEIHKVYDVNVLWIVDKGQNMLLILNN